MSDLEAEILSRRLGKRGDVIGDHRVEASGPLGVLSQNRKRGVVEDPVSRAKIVCMIISE